MGVLRVLQGRKLSGSLGENGRRSQYQGDRTTLKRTAKGLRRTHDDVFATHPLQYVLG
jgi:hypothetical protein